jgi:septum formation protein
VLPRLILASTSSARRAQLARLGLTIECAASGVDEALMKSRRWPAAIIARRLAEAKAKAVFNGRPDAVVIGGDQIATLDGEPFDKPGGHETARMQLRRLSGRTHELATGVAIVGPRGLVSHVEVVRMTMRSLTAHEIDAYLRLDEPYDCAGCYKWEAGGPLLFRGVRTNDPTAILGLPILWVTSTLRSMGYPLP